VRSPRFEPGSSAWQADVLDHSSQEFLRISKNSQRLDYDRMNQELTAQQIKLIPQSTDSKIANTLIQMQNDAKAHITIKTTEYTLRHLAQHSNLLEPEDVKHYIANAITKNSKPISAETKNKWLFCYDNFCKANQIQWKKPYYKVEEKAPLIPTPTNVNAIISNASNKYITIFTLLAEIGCSPMELSQVTQQDIDKQQGII